MTSLGISLARKETSYKILKKKITWKQKKKGKWESQFLRMAILPNQPK